MIEFIESDVAQKRGAFLAHVNYLLRQRSPAITARTDNYSPHVPFLITFTYRLNGFDSVCLGEQISPLVVDNFVLRRVTMEDFVDDIIERMTPNGS